MPPALPGGRGRGPPGGCSKVGIGAVGVVGVGVGVGAEIVGVGVGVKLGEAEVRYHIKWRLGSSMRMR